MLLFQKNHIIRDGGSNKESKKNLRNLFIYKNKEGGKCYIGRKNVQQKFTNTQENFIYLFLLKKNLHTNFASFSLAIKFSSIDFFKSRFIKEMEFISNCYQKKKKNHF